MDESALHDLVLEELVSDVRDESIAVELTLVELRPRGEDAHPLGRHRDGHRRRAGTVEDEHEVVEPSNDQPTVIDAETRSRAIPARRSNANGRGATTPTC